MLAWAQIGLALVKLANLVLGLIHDKQQMDAGTDKAIAIEAASILKKTQTAKEVMAQVEGMTEAQVDAALKELEPK